MERIVISWSLSLSIVTLWIDIGIWMTGHGQQIRETFAIAGNPLLVLFEGQFACLELFGEDVGDEWPANLFLLIRVRSSLLAPPSWYTKPITILTRALFILLMKLTHL